ncbi:MAG: Hsp20/alpha crystallin family protein [Betaproteobacteria bacterium]|nr:Hsp20/alpha crystallin family protein [Betaproteobacteria bacterium]
MANIARFDVLDNALDDLMRGFFVRPMNYEPTVPAQLRIDVTEDAKSYSVRAEIPGVKKEDINVSVDGNQVEISAEVKNEKEIKDGARLLRSERHYGKVYRAFALDQDVDETATQARYSDGILELTLPKKASAAVKRIAIQ